MGETWFFFHADGAKELWGAATDPGPDLHGDVAVLDKDFFCQEVGADGGLVLDGELAVHILVHERRLSDTG